MDQREQDVLEDSSVGDPAAVTAQRLADDELLPDGKERGELFPQGFEQASRQRGHRREHEVGGRQRVDRSRAQGRFTTGGSRLGR
ncbi:hypothetical protein AMK15_16435 [Streptomyces sp. MJM1172]|nr:hypothetical protein AMK15_16435 [Streptomyces sp. MJM1172]